MSAGAHTSDGKIVVEQTIQQALNEAKRVLQPFSLEAQTDAEHLLSASTGLSISELVLSRDAALNTKQRERFDAAVSKRLNGEPIAYITGTKGFYNITVDVSPDVLIPRSETETLLEAALACIKPNCSYNVLDLGTGSGAIALSIAGERVQCKVVAIDICDRACKLAQHNALRLQLDNVSVRCGSWFEPVRGLGFDVIVANPPYIAPNDPHLSQGDLRFEPQGALVAQDHGLACFKHIVAQAKKHLNQQGVLLFEHGCDQGQAVRDTLNGHGYARIKTLHDLSGHERVSVAYVH